MTDLPIDVQFSSMDAGLRFPTNTMLSESRAARMLKSMSFAVAR